MFREWIPALQGNTKWKVAILEDRAENGYPHTLGDLVCLPLGVLDAYDVERLGRLLLHERVHVVQRADPGEAAYFAEKLGYVRTRKRRSDLRPRWNPRANPDLDEWLYMKREDRTIPAAVYESDRPRSLADVKVVDTRTGRRLRESTPEHPHEAVAYRVVEEAAKK